MRPASLKVEGPDYVKNLYVGQEVKLTPDQRVLGDWVAHGIYPIGIALPVDEYVTIQNNGLPIARAKPGEMTATITSVLLTGMVDGAPHPNAAKLFANWVLSKPGMQMFVDQMKTAVFRTDVSATAILRSAAIMFGSPRWFDSLQEDH